MNMDKEMRELDVLLDYLIKHNSEHADEITTLAQKARQLGEDTVYDDLIKGVECMKQSNKSLEHALGILREKER